MRFDAMSFLLLRAPRRASCRALGRPFALGVLAAAGLAAFGAPEGRAQNAAAPFHFPASPSAAAAPRPDAAPAPYAEQIPYGAAVQSPAQTQPLAWRGAVTPEPGYAGAQTLAAPAFAPPPPVMPAAAPVYDPGAAPLRAAPVQAPPAALSPRPSAAPSGSAGATNIFNPVATVNDRLVTRFDVEQRARILAAADETTGVSPGSLLDEALRSLIDDLVKVQAAKAAGIEAGPQAVQRGMEEIASQNGMSVEAMLAFFQARGVARASVEAQVVAEVVWREYLRARYGARIEPTDLEIAAAAAAEPGRTRDQVRSRLIAERATLTSRSVLQELRRKALIEMKTN